jgi:anaerobic selenocysteine-containing dehydrogenase
VTPTPASNEAETPWRSTACILCSINCGIEVRVADRGLVKIRGDRKHPASQGYTCEKALRLDHYQRGAHRLDTPLRRRPDGTHEPIDWDTAIAEIAARLGAIRDAHGGASIFYYGGGGQANHLGGGYGAATRAALGSVYTSNALAQEKTGEFWVDGQLFGRPRCHTSGDFEHAEVAVFVGKNPWHSHGFPRARVVLKELAADPARCLVVIDPRRTETAALADHHLQVKPGTDAWCLAALVAVIVQEDLANHPWIAAHTHGFDDVAAHFGTLDVPAFCAAAGVAEDDVRAVARRIARAASVSIFEDLGIQQAPNSTLCSYLEKLVYLLTGNFAQRGSMNIHTRLARLSGGGGGGGDRRSPVTGQRIITGLIPAAAIPDEILTDHPRRFRAMIVESANPAHSLPDSPRMREALDALDCLVVIDVALTETARRAHYVLPAPSQYEKWEAAFFTLEFPRNTFQLRAPVLPPLPGTLAEPEIHRRLVRALGGYTDADLVPLHEAAALGREAFAMAFLGTLSARPELTPYAALLLYETLGPTLGPGREATAAVWGLCQTCFMAYPESVRRAGHESGEALFDAILAHPEGVTFTVDPYEETWARMDTPDARVRLAVPELLEALAALPSTPPARDPAFPFVLSAGERRTSTANTLFRDPTWRTKDRHGALRLCPDDARALGVSDGDRVRVSTRRGSAEAVVEVSPTMRPGHVSLPNGTGLDGAEGVVGVAPNELTASADRDPIAGTPWHKHVPARIERVA